MRFKKTIGIIAAAVAVAGGVVFADPASAGIRNCYAGWQGATANGKCGGDATFRWKLAVTCKSGPIKFPVRRTITSTVFVADNLWKSLSCNAGESVENANPVPA